MNRTNSNSITSILILALNYNKSFRDKILKEKFGIEQNDNLCFYDGTHTPLLFPEMKNKEVDVYAREIGKHKVTLMIEVKASLQETLQTSQGKKGEYSSVSKNRGIALFYIIPRQYCHREEIPKNGKIIEWEEILEIAETCKDKKGLSEQIRNFVDLDENEIEFSNQEKEYFKNSNKLKKVFQSRCALEETIKKNCLQSKEPEFSDKVNPYEFGAYWNNKNFFLGYSYIYKDFNDYNNYKGKSILMLTVTETQNNTILGNKGFYYLEGYYYIPIKSFGNELTINDLINKDIDPSIYGELDISGIQQLEADNNIPILNSFIYNIKLLCNEETILKKFKSVGEFEVSNEYFGCYYTKKNSKKEDNVFIGFDFAEDSPSTDLLIEVDKDGWEKKSFKQIQPELYDKFINANTTDELIKKFAELIDKALDSF